MVKNIEHLDAGPGFGGGAEAGGALLQVLRVGVAVDGGDGALAAHDFREFHEGLLTAFEVVDADAHEAAAAGGVAGEGDDGDALTVSFVDGVGEFVGIGAGDDDAVGASEEELLDVFGLALRVFFVRCAPVDFDLDAVLGAQLAGGVLGSGARGEEEHVAL